MPASSSDVRSLKVMTLINLGFAEKLHPTATCHEMPLHSHARCTTIPKESKEVAANGSSPSQWASLTAAVYRKRLIVTRG